MTRTKLSITASSVIAAMTLVGCSGNMQNVEVDTKKTKTSAAKNQTASTVTTDIETFSSALHLEARTKKSKQLKQTAKAPYREDTWQQIYRGFRIPNYNREPSVQQFISQFSRHPKHLTKMSERANPYLPYIVDQLKQRNMPSEIALLPFVESSFRPHAYSHAHAAGLWQFIPATGKRYGLKQNAMFDGRYDPFLATQAALG